jgi:hypothetical protein
VASRHGGLRIRQAVEADGDALAAFACSTGPWFEEEVERHIRGTALARAIEAGSSYRVILFEEDRELWAVGAHQPERLLTTEDLVPAARLVVLGLRLDRQGATAADGSRYSDIAMAGLLTDAMWQHRRPVLTTLVASGNVRSQRLCRRHGLTSETIVNARYIRMTGRFALPARRTRS